MDDIIHFSPSFSSNNLDFPTQCSDYELADYSNQSLYHYVHNLQQQQQKQQQQPQPHERQHPSALSYQEAEPLLLSSFSGTTDKASSGGFGYNFFGQATMPTVSAPPPSFFLPLEMFTHDNEMDADTESDSTSLSPMFSVSHSSDMLDNNTLGATFWDDDDQVSLFSTTSSPRNDSYLGDYHVQSFPFPLLLFPPPSGIALETPLFAEQPQPQDLVGGLAEMDEINEEEDAELESVSSSTYETMDPTYNPKGKGSESFTSPSGSGSHNHKRKTSNSRAIKKTVAPRAPAVGTRKVKMVTSLSMCRKHIPCSLANYGCKLKFSSRHEWKRHCATMHIKEYVYRCSECLPHKSYDFNRKDLFVQHVKRMHSQSLMRRYGGPDYEERVVARNGGNGEGAPMYQAVLESDIYNIERLPYEDVKNATDKMAVACYTRIRHLPAKSRCVICSAKFSCWEWMMDHMADHLEKGPGYKEVCKWGKDAEIETYLVEQRIIARDGKGVLKLVTKKG